MNNEHTLTPGIVLNGKSHAYTIQKVLGQGSFGITYLAATRVKVSGPLGELETSVQVAIKEFFMRDINGREENTVTCSSKDGLYENYKRKFAREARNLSRLKHPNIVKVLESFEANNTVYYAMEYLEGGSLDKHITQANGLSETEAIGYVKQIGSALTYMHQHKMLHLDLKPGNIMLRKNGEAVLIDFGLSKQYDANGEPESSTTIGGGTPGYAPIEQANYQEGKDFPVTMDVYALGATMFKMLTGVRPPKASDILNDGFPSAELRKRGVSGTSISSVAQAMSAMKKDRPQSIEEFVASLQLEEQTRLNERIRVGNHVHEVFFSFCESSHPNYRSFQVTMTDTYLSVESAIEGNMVKKLRLPFNRERYIAFLRALDSLKLCRTPNVESRGFCGGENIFLRIDQSEGVFHYGTKYEHFGTLIGDVYGLKELVEKQIPESVYENLWTKETNDVVDEDKDKGMDASVWIRRLIILILSVLLIMGLIKVCSSNDESVPTSDDWSVTDSASVDSVPHVDLEPKMDKYKPSKTITSPKQNADSDVENNRVYDKCDEMPSFPGGQNALIRYISNELKYPTSAKEMGISGRVTVSFVVNKDGSISQVKVVRRVDPDLDREAVRVVSNMPKWNPLNVSSDDRKVCHVKS